MCEHKVVKKFAGTEKWMHSPYPTNRANISTNIEFQKAKEVNDDRPS